MYIYTTVIQPQIISIHVKCHREIMLRLVMNLLNPNLADALSSIRVNRGKEKAAIQS